jgi:AcrR family transcriptional regulator
MPPRTSAVRSQPSLRPGRHPLPREFVAQHKRRRITDAIVELTAEHGYESTKIGDIVRRAGVARKTLYDNFNGKEDVFLAAFDAAAGEALKRVETACAEAGADWERRIEAGLAAFLDFVAEDPARARMCMIEAMSATPASSRRYEATVQRFVALARDNAPSHGRLSETTEDTVIGGVAWIVHQKIRRGEAEKAPQLLAELSGFALAPFRAFV